MNKLLTMIIAAFVSAASTAAFAEAMPRKDEMSRDSTSELRTRSGALVKGVRLGRKWPGEAKKP